MYIVTKYAAFLRGINIGGNNKVEMSTLKQLFESLGYSKVSTYLNSGNVVFSSTGKSVAHMSKKIEAEIFKIYKLQIRVLVRDTKNILYTWQSVPPTWKDNPEKDTHVAFLFEDIDMTLIPKTDKVMRIDGALLCNIDLKNWSKDTVYKFVNNNKISKQVTVRSLRTVRRVLELLDGGLL
jgi:uncharacterized protein (DUF1697 family)